VLKYTENRDEEQKILVLHFTPMGFGFVFWLGYKYFVPTGLLMILNDKVAPQERHKSMLLFNVSYDLLFFFSDVI